MNVHMGWKELGMDVGTIELAGQVVPYLTAAATFYGTQVLDKVTDRSTDIVADATTSWGQRILERFRSSGRAKEIETAVLDVAENPADETFTAALLAQVNRALREDPTLAAEIAELAATSPAPASTYTVTVTNSPQAIVGNYNTMIGNNPPPAGRA